MLGPNGSGKTTFLKLLAENSYLYGEARSKIRRQRASQLWDIRSRISFVSGDFQAWFQCRQTCLELVVSGFFGSVGLHDQPTRRQESEALAWLDAFDLADWADTDVQTISYGRLRMMLIIRAMVTLPAVLLLDEPVAGLDLAAKDSVLSMIQSLASNGTTLVYVTHHVPKLWIQSLTWHLWTKVGLRSKGREMNSEAGNF